MVDFREERDKSSELPKQVLSYPNKSLSTVWLEDSAVV